MPVGGGLKATSCLSLGSGTKLSLEKEEGKHFISLSVGDKQVLREEVDEIEDLRSESDGFAVCIGHDFNPQPGFIRGLVVLEKQ